MGRGVLYSEMAEYPARTALTTLPGDSRESLAGGNQAANREAQMATYTAKSLEDVAQMFDELGRREHEAANFKGNTVATKRYHSGCSSAYLDAARILRETKLEAA